MSQELFRKEAVEARQSSWLGEVSLAQPVHLWVLTTAAIVVTLAIILFLTFGTYTRRARVAGQLVPTKGLVTVLAPATGIVSRVVTGEGGTVQAGQMLAVVTVPRDTLTSGNTLEALGQLLEKRKISLASAQSAQQDQLDAQAKGLTKQLATTRLELTQIDVEIATRRDQLELANETLKRLRQLRADKYVSELQIKQQESVALELVSETQLLQRQAISVNRKVEEIQQALQELPKQREMFDAGFERDLAMLDQERVENQVRGELAVSAPVDGVIATQLIKQGQAVQVGQPLLVLLPGDGLLEAQLLVPSRSIGFVDIGDKVLLRYQAFPYQKFGHYVGHINRISRSALTSVEQGALTGNAEVGEGRYKVTAALDSQSVNVYHRAEALKPGMQLEADILGEQRRLIEWVFEPILSIGGTMFEAPTKVESDVGGT